MRRFWFIALVLSFLLGGLALKTEAESTGIRGNYVEVRTASVFAGACHYNGELTTTGRDAVLAWSIASGKWGEVDLAGVRVVAIVSADANLSEENAVRRSEIVVDANASHRQAVAILDLLKRNYQKSIGEIRSVRSAPITFDSGLKSYSVSAAGVASVDVEAMPDDLCCKMPNLVWYSPLVRLDNRKVGYTRDANYAGGEAGDSWQRSGENSAFYGSFSF
jgi:hypothetical protein